jgi:hypothetical protein
MPQTMPFPRREVPMLARVRQKLASDHIADVRGDTCRKLQDSGSLKKIKPGDRIAITAGSRGMGGFLELLRGCVQAVKNEGGAPFLIPAMGSHGGATEEGQIAVLEKLGVTEESVGAPIRATMETSVLGNAENGATAHLDKIADEADGVIVLGRTKTHPESAQGLASGLLKMTTVGLGKQAGAQEAHSHDLWKSVAAVPRLTLANAKVLCGVAVVENALRQPVAIEVVPPTYEAFLDSDKKLLKVAHQHLATLPFSQLDVLIVDEIGKNISGTGMDLNVIGSWRMKGGEHKPDFFRIVALSLTDESLGNGLGIGLADFTTQRFARNYDPAVTYVNLLTATEPDAMNTWEAGLPLALSSDREAIEVALYSALASSQPRVCRIENTARLDEFWVSPALLNEVEKNSGLEVLSPPAPPEFNATGNLF